MNLPSPSLSIINLFSFFRLAYCCHSGFSMIIPSFITSPFSCASPPTVPLKCFLASPLTSQQNIRSPLRHTKLQIIFSRSTHSYLYQAITGRHTNQICLEFCLTFSTGRHACHEKSSPGFLSFLLKNRIRYAYSSINAQRWILKATSLGCWTFQQIPDKRRQGILTQKVTELKEPGKRGLRV